MSDQHSHQHVAKAVKTYLLVFYALLIGTVLTVWASFIDFGSHELNVAIALLIATVKAFLVAGFFMHMISEKKMIYAIMISTAFFVVGLMGLTIFSYYDVPVYLK